jgi:predicted esterase
MRVLHVETPTHGRVLIDDGNAAGPISGTLVVFHGYGQAADDVLAEVQRIPGISTWRVAAIQGLHRFYTRNNQRVIASWMTRQDRELAISDNVAYVDKAVEVLGGSGFSRTVVGRAGARPSIVFLGFSQGAAMAYRAATLGCHPAAGIIALAGDIPPELKTNAGTPVVFPPVLIGAGTRDAIYPKAKLDADVAFLASRGAPHQVVRFTGGHVWTETFRREAGRWLRTLTMKDSP